MTSRQAAWTTLGSLLEMQTLRPHSSSPESEFAPERGLQVIKVWKVLTYRKCGPLHQPHSEVAGQSRLHIIFLLFTIPSSPPLRHLPPNPFQLQWLLVCSGKGQKCLGQRALFLPRLRRSRDLFLPQRQHVGDLLLRILG